MTIECDVLGFPQNQRIGVASNIAEEIPILNKKKRHTIYPSYVHLISLSVPRSHILYEVIRLYNGI